MLDSEPNNNETGTSEATGQAAGTAPAPTVFNGPAEPSAVPSVPAAVFQPPPVVLFQAPAAAPAPRATRDAVDPLIAEHDVFWSRAQIGFTEFPEGERARYPPSGA